VLLTRSVPWKDPLFEAAPRSNPAFTMKNLCSTFSDIAQLPSDDGRYISSTCLDPETERSWVTVEKRALEEGEPAEVELWYRSETWSDSLEVRKLLGIAAHVGLRALMVSCHFTSQSANCSCDVFCGDLQHRHGTKDTRAQISTRRTESVLGPKVGRDCFGKGG
jgi:hypothetical protein